ncbi:MAG: hypothetical protein JWM16_3304 [Verrucomicrobiales bacterium]|nr:hypothetical protein [Verrucomicrobiales bacterium]
MNAKGHSDWNGCWSLLWRAFVFFPYILVVSIVLCALWMSRWFLPCCAAALFYIRDWTFASLICVAWLLALWTYRHFNLARFFEPPPSLL